MNVGIVEWELDHHRTRSIIDPLQLTKLGEIRSQVRETASELIDIATTTVGLKITGVGIRIQLISIGISKGAINGRTVLRSNTIVRLPSGREGGLLFVEQTVVVETGHLSWARACFDAQLSHGRPADHSRRFVIDKAREVTRRLIIVPLLSTEVAHKTVLKPVPVVMNRGNLRIYM